VELDCTPDISKQEQASVIIRYVHTDDKKNATINESFVGLTETLTGVLDNLGLELANFRGKSYDWLKYEGYTQGCASIGAGEVS